MSGDWTIWTGTINIGATFQTSCNSCNSEAECNFHGECAANQTCICDSEDISGFQVNTYSGTHCEFARPCGEIQGEAGDVWDVIFMDSDASIWKAYGRAVYRHKLGTGNITHGGANDSTMLIYSGSRWFYQVYEGTLDKGPDYWLHYSEELHSFWDRVYTEKTQAVSDPSNRPDPVAVDFFVIGRKGEKFGPLGELIPVNEYQLANGIVDQQSYGGYFECILNSTSIPDFLAENLGG